MTLRIKSRWKRAGCVGQRWSSRDGSVKAVKLDLVRKRRDDYANRIHHTGCLSLLQLFGPAFLEPFRLEIPRGKSPESRSLLLDANAVLFWIVFFSPGWPLILQHNWEVAISAMFTPPIRPPTYSLSLSSSAWCSEAVSSPRTTSKSIYDMLRIPNVYITLHYMPLLFASPRFHSLSPLNYLPLPSGSFCSPRCLGSMQRS